MSHWEKLEGFKMGKIGLQVWHGNVKLSRDWELGLRYEDCTSKSEQLWLRQQCKTYLTGLVGNWPPLLTSSGFQHLRENCGGKLLSDTPHLGDGSPVSSGLRTLEPQCRTEQLQLYHLQAPVCFAHQLICLNHCRYRQAIVPVGCGSQESHHFLHSQFLCGHFLIVWTINLSLGITGLSVLVVQLYYK